MGGVFFFGNFEVEVRLANFFPLPIFYCAVNHSDEVSDYRLSANGIDNVVDAIDTIAYLQMNGEGRGVITFGPQCCSEQC
jgi:hypothetical protein